MQIRNTDERYGLVSKVLHWVLALLILGLVWLGWALVDMGYYDPWYKTVATAHESLGMIALALAAFKLLWAFYTATPAPQQVLRPWERFASRLVHRVLFLMMFVLPLTGYWTSTSDGDGVPVFGWLEIPAVMNVSDALRDWSIDVHFYGAYGLLALAILHAAAALKHEFLDRHGTLRRML